MTWQRVSRATWDLAPNITRSVEAVHRLDNLGAVVAHTAYGTSREGFDAEWRQVALLTFTGDLISRVELFDEADLDAALARFDELHTQAPRLENAASEAAERFFAYLGAQNWAAMADILADDRCRDDRRRAVNAGLWAGRDVVIAELRETTDFGVLIGISELIATRGQRLVLGRVRWSASDQGAEAFQSEALCITEVEGDGQIAAIVMFDPDDLEGAIAQLDARYLAGDAAAHTEIWSVITRTYAAFNRHELPPTTPDWVNIDHRRGIAFAPGDATAYIRASQDPQGSIYVETVHRLSNLGAVFMWAGHGTSQEGFEAEWRGINVATVEGDRINRGEIFDEADLDAALARFDELQQQAPRLENAASRVYEHYKTCFAQRDWAAMARILDKDIFTNDRRRVVNAGVLQGRDVVLADMRALAEVGANITSAVVCSLAGSTCSSVLCASGGKTSGLGSSFGEVAQHHRDRRRRPDHGGGIVFDPDDIDAAFEELDARYLAGEAAAHARHVVGHRRAYAAFNRHELPATTPDSWSASTIGRLLAIEPGDLSAYIRAVWDSTPDVQHLHRGRASAERPRSRRHPTCQHGTSHEGFDAEWRMIDVSHGRRRL